MDLSRVLFATLLGVIVLGETLGIMQTFGLILVSTGLLLLKYHPPFLYRLFVKEENSVDNKAAASQTVAKSSRDGVKPIYIMFAFFSCMLNALSGLLDKILMKDMNSSQLR